MRSVLIDSSAFLSLEDPDEEAHAVSRRVLEDLGRARVRLLTTNFIFDETYTLILSRLGRGRAVVWGQKFLAGEFVELVRVEEDHEQRAWEIILAFQDKDFSYTDATSFAVAESLGVDEVFALDRHFHQYGKLLVMP